MCVRGEITLAESVLCSELRALCAAAGPWSIIDKSALLQDLFSSLERVLPHELSTIYDFWRHEGLDATYPLRIETREPQVVQLFGLALLVGEQVLMPLYACIAVHQCEDRLEHVSCAIGEIDTETVGGRFVTAPYSALGKSLCRLSQRKGAIPWAFYSSRGLLPAGDTLIVTSRCCPVGCGFDVVVLRSVHNGALFCFCSSCGCVWQSPDDAQHDASLDGLRVLSDIAPAGIEVPASVDLDGSKFLQSVVSRISVAEWEASVAELNYGIRSAAS